MLTRRGDVLLVYCLLTAVRRGGALMNLQFHRYTSYFIRSLENQRTNSYSPRDNGR